METATACANCGRATRTSSDGFCVECWEPKASGRRFWTVRKTQEEGPSPLELEWYWWAFGAGLSVAVATLVYGCVS